MDKEAVLRELLWKSEGKDSYKNNNNINVFLALHNEDWFVSNFDIDEFGHLKAVNINCSKCVGCSDCEVCFSCEYCKSCFNCEDCKNVIGGKNLKGVKFDKPTEVFR